LPAAKKCADGRAEDLSRAYRGVLEAAAKPDARAIYEAAKDLEHKAHGTSEMYTKCWDHMVSMSNILASVGKSSADIVRIGAAAGY